MTETQIQLAADSIYMKMEDELDVLIQARHFAKAYPENFRDEIVDCVLDIHDELA